MQKDRKANDVCENFVRKESTTFFQFYHEEARHGGHYLHKSTCWKMRDLGHYLHKSTCWNMRDLERLTKVCKESNCAFIIRNETSVYVFIDE